MTMDTTGLIRRGFLLLIGALILLCEVVTDGPIRIGVVVLALVLMGVVSLDQMFAWVSSRQPPPMPVEGLQHPQDPPTPIRPPDDAA